MESGKPSIETSYARLRVRLNLTSSWHPPSFYSERTGVNESLFGLNEASCTVYSERTGVNESLFVSARRVRMRTSPELAAYNPESSAATVDLPQPLGPTIATRSPACDALARVLVARSVRRSKLHCAQCQARVSSRRSIRALNTSWHQGAHHCESCAACGCSRTACKILAEAEP